MKKIILSIFTLLICCAIIQAQCPTGDITLDTQQEVDDFAATYPNCISLNGSLEIGTGSSIINLDGLSPITSIEGTLNIRYNSSLTNLDGLSQLTFIGGSIIIRNNTALTNLDGLSQITSIDGGLSINYNLLLANLDGLSQLSSVGGLLLIQSNTILTNLAGLSQITSVGGNLYIRSNSSIINIDALNQITSLGGNMWIDNNPSLANLDGLSSLTTISGDLRVADNDVLSDISGLETLNTLGITSVYIEDNPKLSFCNLTSICNYIQNGGTTFISNNALGCNDLSEVAASCNSSPSCSDDLIIFTSQAQIDNFVINNPSCTAIVGDIKIINSTDISNLNGLNQITSIDGGLWVENNTLLTDFAGLENLTSIGGILHISSNSILSGFAGFDNLDYTTIFFLTVRDNATLSICGVEGICTHLQNGGTANISNNASGCNSIAEVSQSCGLPFEDNQCDFQIDATFADNGTFLQSFDWEYDIYNGYSGTAQYYISDLATTPDGRIFGIGFIGNLLTLPYFEIEHRLGIFVLTPSGELDYIRQPGLPHSYISGQIVESNGHLIYSSDYDNLNCFDPDNLTTPCFTPVVFSSNITKLTAQTDGKILVGTQVGEVLRYLPDGTADSGFNGNASINGAIGRITDIDFLQNEQIIVTGAGGIMRLNSDGTTDTTFGVNGLFTDTEFGGSRNQFVELPTGNYAVLLAGGDVVGRLIYVSPDGLMITTNPYFNPPGQVSHVRDMLALPSGEILIASNYFFANGAGSYLTVINTNGTVGYSSSVNATSLVFQGSKILVGGAAYGDHYRQELGTWVNRYECDAIPLPIEMVNPLQVRLENQTALLTWRTATETNNAGFEIQRSQDGIAWEKIAWQDGQGTTTSSHNYIHRDTNPLFGTSYYRLRQVDFDESFTYSNVVSLRYVRTQVSVYPNPVKGKLYIQTNEQAIERVLIFDATGRQINAPLTDDTINVSGFAKGIYMVKVRVNGEDFYEKIIVD